MTVKGVRYASYAAFTRIVFEVETASPYVLLRASDGRSVTLSPYDGPFLIKTPLPAVHDGVVTGLELREDAGRTSVIVRLGASAGEVKDFALLGPDRIVIDILKGAAPVQVPPTERTQTVIVLDPGHGGKDGGIVTAKGQEKTLTLDLAIEIRKMLQKNPRLKVVLTRDKDQALTCDERAAVSNAAGARLLVALHAAPGAAARVFIQELLDEPGMRAVRSVNGDFLGYEAGNEQRELLWDTQQASHAQESGTLGRKLARQLAGQDNAEPLQSPLVLLKAVDAAAVMIETGVEMERARTAEAIARGIEQYAGEN
jgi:N-acetylmuramoyl-L-alanine amidase